MTAPPHRVDLHHHLIPHALRSLTELVGADHILFGSDFPFAPELATTRTAHRRNTS